MTQGRREGVGWVGLGWVESGKGGLVFFCSGAEEVLRSFLCCFPSQEEMIEFHPSWTRLWGAARGGDAGEGAGRLPIAQLHPWPLVAGDLAA